MASVVDLLLVVYRTIEIMLKLVINHGAASIGDMTGNMENWGSVEVCKELNVESSIEVGEVIRTKSGCEK